ncbi:MAG: hypothetical protein EOO46_07780 [Flavobacterium sp.]|nr:MAG: hypothetical protein EOO46_07780 [Flavobacterium sp.]
MADAKKSWDLFQAMNQGQSLAKNLENLNKGLAHTDLAIAHEKTKELPTTWAIRALIASRIALIDTADIQNSVAKQQIATEAITKAEALNVKKDKTVENDVMFGDNTTNYTYDGNKLMEINRYEKESDIYTYTGNLITKIEKFKIHYSGTPDVETELLTTDHFKYNSSNQLIEFKTTYPDSEMERTTTYAYNANNTVTFEQHEQYIGSEQELLKTGTITLENGEISKLQVVKTFDSFTANYNYDTKNSLFKNVLGYDKLIFTHIIGKQGSMTSGETVLAGISHNFVNNGELEYTYNSDNYPLTAKQRFFGSVLHSYEFFY